MNQKERFFVNNYSFFGESTKKRCGYNEKEAQQIKEKYKEKGVYFLPVKKINEEPMPVQYKTHKEGGFGAVQFAIASLAPEDQDKILELAKNMPSSEVLINYALAIQMYRMQIGLENEVDQRRLLDSTETTMNTLISIIQSKYNIDEEQEVNVNINNSITAILDGINDDEDDDMDEINIDMNKNINDFI